MYENYYLYNGQDSVTNLTNTTGASTSSYDYDSFGNSITRPGTSSNSYKYSTKELDSTGLIYFAKITDTFQSNRDSVPDSR